MDVETIMLPGIGGSGGGHWQTLWRLNDPFATVFQPSDWDRPDLDDWVAALDRAVALAAQPPLLVAHSLGCLLVAHWAARGRGLVAGAFLVAVPDPDGPVFPAEQAATFRSVPRQPMLFPTLMIASSDDPYGSLEFGRRCADAWRADLITAGALGHINEASGVGAWPSGRTLLTSFRRRLAGEQPA
ncbi:alpha/beta fold hydrolase [Phenylobacterium sp. LjRoot225]|uniref:RBBP9/YdeN family alpha/beta hydrolase n=1 Tax=Phenylobacterium sp. LjRoot225 TaxID=3342285 RepID=UPI003ECC4C56